MSSFDQVIKNILADIFAEEEQQEVTRPRARPEGLMSSTRPRARPEDVEPVQPSASESTSKFVAAMSDYDDTPEEGVEIPLAFFKGTARDLEGRYKTTGMQLAKLNKNRVDSNIKVAAVEEDTTVDDLIAELEMSMKPMLRPRARPKSAEEIQTIRAEQASYTKLDTVKDIQQALNIAGIEVGGKPLVVDGIKGRNTLAAIKAFQKREGLKVDGIVGKNTKAALYRVMPKPEIKEEELQPSIYDKPAQVGPDQMQVGFQDPSIVDPTTGRPYTPEGLMRREQYLSKEEYPTKEIKEIERVEDAKVASLIDSIPVPESVKKDLESVNQVTKAVLSPVGRNFMNDMLFGGGELSQTFALALSPVTKVPLMNLGRQKPAGAEVFSQDALDLMRKLVLDKGIIDKGSVSIGKEVYGKGGLSVKQTGGSSGKEIIKALAEGSDPINEVKLMLGQFNAKIDNNGDIIITDQFNFNEIINPIDGKKYTPEQYEKAIKEGRFTQAEVLTKVLAPLSGGLGNLDYEMIRALGFVLGSRSYADKDGAQGRRFEINLGPAVTRPKARPNS